MAGTIVKTILLSVCLLNTNAEYDYTFDIRDAKVVSFLPEYFSKTTSMYATMYNDSFTVIDGIIELLKIPPPDAEIIVEVSKYDPSTNKWSKRASALKPTLLCDFIKNNVPMMKYVYKFTNFTAKECPIYPGVYAVQHLYSGSDDEGMPNHVPASTNRAFYEMRVQGSNEPAISVSLTVDVVPKLDDDDD